MNKSFATRLEPDLEERFDKAVKLTGMRAADLIRYGVRKVVTQIEKDGGLLVRASTTPTRKPKGRAAK